METSAGNPVEILIVEDSAVQAVRLQYTLEDHGFQVLTARNGQEALASLRHHQPTLIISDIVMPGVDGYELCRQVKADEQLKEIPIILLTALSDLQDVVKALSNGADNFVTKPYTEEFLLSRIRHVLMNRELREQGHGGAGVEIFFDNQRYFFSSKPSQMVDLLLSTFENAVQKNLELEEANQQLLTMQRTLKQQNLELERLNERLQSELLLARRIQQTLLPAAHPHWPGLDLAGSSTPAREVGGDFYAYHRFEASECRQPGDEHLLPKYAVAVGDVSGKGMPAALLMAASLTLFQAMIDPQDEPARLLARLDQALLPYTQTTRMNCALCYVEIIPTADGQPSRLCVANAGCVAPLLKPANGTVCWVEAGGMPLGVNFSKNFGYQEVALNLSPGDLLLLSSDGVIEAVNTDGEMFGFERLEQAVKNGPATSAEAMLNHLKGEVAAFMGRTEPRDDITMVVVQV
jgi:serine phosphatase RsbU (regulator of sigma subunit)/CheY-like chemotaxis protein